LIKNKFTGIYIKKVGEGIKNKSKLIVKSYNDSLNIQDPNELKSNHKNLIIIDDIMLENECQDYYMRERERKRLQLIVDKSNYEPLKPQKR
jgi:glutaredoxin 2